MSAPSLLAIPSQEKMCANLVKAIQQGEPFILLSGESGSGRTAVLESLVNATERNMRAVYVPCRADMSLQRLRETFLRQLLPGEKCSLELNLADNLIRHPVPGKGKILVIADDADMVVSSFFTELCALYQEFVGQNRFAFVLSGHPLWVEQKLRQPLSFEPEEFAISPLSGGESMALCRQIFKNNGLMRVYNSVESALPAALQRQRGNIADIIRYTGQIMAEQQNTSDKNVKGTAAPQKTAAKKGGSGGIFITILCIIIVLGCLVSFFVGGNLFKGSDPDELKQVGTTAEQSTAGTDSAALSEPILDDGALNQPVNGGLEAQVPPAQTSKSITLSGEELDKIEEAGSNRPDLPRPGSVAGSQVNNQNSDTDAANQGAAAPAVKSLSREANALRRAAAATAANRPAERAAGQTSVPASTVTTAPAAGAAAAAPGAGENSAASAATAVPQVADSASKAATAQLSSKAGNSSDGSRIQQQAAAASAANTSAAAAGRNASRSGVVRPENVPFSGQAIPGGSSEIVLKNDAHYTVQVVAGHNRQSVVQVSAALNGRYWIYETVREGRPWYVLIVGEYPSRAGALDAARQLPAAVRAARPFAKSFAAVKSEMALGQ